MILDKTKLRTALRIFSRRLKGEGIIKRYSGSSEQICEQIIDECFNGRYFQVSTGHFSEFYMRDFGICVQSLLELDYEGEVKKTLEYALNIYSKENKITTTITNGKALDIFAIGPDSLAFLLFSLRISNSIDLVKQYKHFLEIQIRKYFERIVDKETGLAGKGYFSSIKDHAKRNSSCYDQCMLAMISREANALKLANPFKVFNYKELVKKYFWEEHYFRDSLDADYISGDANVFPYWTGLFREKEMIKRSVYAIRQEGLDKPFPLKYTRNCVKGQYFLFPLNLLTRNYEGNTIWCHLGLCYLDVIKKVDKELLGRYLRSYEELIVKHKNFIELFNPDGTIYKTPFYLADSSMIWCCKYLSLAKQG